MPSYRALLARAYARPPRPWYTSIIVMRLLRSRFLALFAAVFVALPAAAFARTSYFCHMSGQVSAHCCCKKSVSEHCQTRIEQRDCCELVSSDAHASSPAARATAHEVPSAALVATIMLALNAHAPEAQPAATAAVETHPPGPPRFLAHCSFLI